MLQVVAGEGLGGTSRINGCLYTRGLKDDWDRWNRPGWSYDELLPYFVKSENTLTQPESSFRGKKGMSGSAFDDDDRKPLLTILPKVLG